MERDREAEGERKIERKGGGRKREGERKIERDEERKRLT